MAIQAGLVTEIGDARTQYATNKLSSVFPDVRECGLSEDAITAFLETLARVYEKHGGAKKLGIIDRRDFLDTIGCSNSIRESDVRLYVLTKPGRIAFNLPPTLVHSPPGLDNATLVMELAKAHENFVVSLTGQFVLDVPHPTLSDSATETLANLGAVNELARQEWHLGPGDFRVFDYASLKDVLPGFSLPTSSGPVVAVISCENSLIIGCFGSRSNPVFGYPNMTHSLSNYLY
jgi:hypothetical protein